MAACTPILALLRTKKAREVFVPAWQEWTGINGVAPVELQYREEMPETSKARARPIQPSVVGATTKLWMRMLNYFYEKSVSPFASPIVIAPKATAPFWRICGDYRGLNKYVVVPQDVIPTVRREIEKTKGFSVFEDLDLANAFHQLKLAPYISERLSVATPWGLYRPNILPEGVGPASGILQKVMDEVFADYKEWMIVIFDNLLVLATDFQDLYHKLLKVIDRCHERHVILKMEKSWIGVKSATFFGYEVSGGGYRLSQKRREHIASIPMPKDTKGMQRFLGATLSRGFCVAMRRIRPAAVHYFRSGSRTSSGPRSGRLLPSSRRSSRERPRDGTFSEEGLCDLLRGQGAGLLPGGQALRGIDRPC